MVVLTLKRAWRRTRLCSKQRGQPLQLAGIYKPTLFHLCTPDSFARYYHLCTSEVVPSHGQVSGYCCYSTQSSYARQTCVSAEGPLSWTCCSRALYRRVGKYYILEMTPWLSQPPLYQSGRRQPLRLAEEKARGS